MKFTQRIRDMEDDYIQYAGWGWWTIYDESMSRLGTYFTYRRAYRRLQEYAAWLAANERNEEDDPAQ